MAMTFMQEVVRISDKFMDRADPDSIDRQGRLGQLVILVMIFYTILGIGFVKMQELEKRRPHIIHDVDVSFELAAPPPEPEFKVGEVPKAPALTAGDNPNPGSEESAKPAQADTVSIPAIKADETANKPNVQAKPVPSHHTTEAAPVAVASVQDVKAQPVAAPKEAPKSDVKPAPLTGIANNQDTSGASQAGGTPDGKAGGTGTGGEGNGGGGSGQGDPGNGSGTGKEGSIIATKLPNTGARAMGNIGPYKRDMLIKLAQKWHPKKYRGGIIIIIALDHDGKLLSAELLQSSGNKKADQEALTAVEETEFAALPDWYRADSMSFKIDLDQVEGARQ